MTFDPAIKEFDLQSDGLRTPDAFVKFCTLENCIFFDGCGDLQTVKGLNRYSFLAADPIEKFELTDTQPYSPNRLKQWIQKFGTAQVSGLPPFQGGIAGLFSYEFGRHLEKLPCSPIDDFNAPTVSLGCYDVVLAIDHELQKAWLISQGWPETDFKKRKDLAERRLSFFSELLNNEESVQSFESTPALTPQSIMNPMDVLDGLEIYSDFSKTEFLQSVSKAVDYIREGDVFQINLSQRLLAPITKSPTQLYLDLRTVNPAPFSCYLDFGSGQVVSASPERLVCLQNGCLEARPIKGTRKRTRFPEVDLNTQIDLLSSEKDRAENVMIVDLMRNDLARISEPDSITVQKLCGIEEFQNVMHLVSVVQSKMCSEFDSIDLIGRIFPGGSITGAPKIRAMEIIAELEPTVRGPYCGSLGYFNAAGEADFNILIRTITAKDGWWQIPVGGGIVSDSIPEKEYDETWTKAVGMLNGIRQNPPPQGQRHSTKIASAS